MEITESSPQWGVVYAISMNNGFTMTGRIAFAPEGGSTRVTWSDDGEIANPFFRFLPLFMKGMIGGKLEEGLRRIKGLAEKKPVGV